MKGAGKGKKRKQAGFCPPDFQEFGAEKEERGKERGVSFIQQRQSHFLAYRSSKAYRGVTHVSFPHFYRITTKTEARGC